MKRQLTPTTDKPWFCFDGDQSEYFATEDEALEASKKAIRYYLDEAWDEQVNQVQVGKITHTTKQTNVTNRPSDEELDEELVDGSGEYWPEEILYKCNYEALPLNSN
ncbi:hypothetical protein [Vibrio coralliilyticus]|uniref:hypothetical protein n=1 Tax=Vibrio coralliilyticus TaxID=190893 RepID=UPI001E5792F3|nr:hypothetical protein [Vibrio coralliilyticus]MCC2521043.1 hypothetical protein [Vibrio coralliilyticus]